MENHQLINISSYHSHRKRSWWSVTFLHHCGTVTRFSADIPGIYFTTKWDTSPKIFPSHNWAEHGPQIAPCLGICASTEHKVPWASSLHPKWHVHRVSRLSTTYRILSLHFTVQKDKPPKLPLPLGDLGRYLIYGSLHPPKFTTQMASQPVHTLFQGPWLYPTDT